MSQRFTGVWVGICYLLIQIFGHFILSKMYQQYHSTICVLWNNKIAGCLVIYWRNTVSAFSWEASKWLVSLSGLGDSIWVASLKPPPAKIVLSSGVCSMSGKDDVLRSSTERLLKIPKTKLKTSVNVLLVTVLRLSGTRCRPTWELLPPCQLSKLT